MVHRLDVLSDHLIGGGTPAGQPGLCFGVAPHEGLEVFPHKVHGRLQIDFVVVHEHRDNIIAGNAARLLQIVGIDVLRGKGCVVRAWL